MSEGLNENPYQASDVRMDGTRSRSSTANVPGGVISLLEETRPWVRLVGIVIRIVGILVIIGGVVMSLIGVLGMAMGAGMGPFEGGLAIVIGLVYILMAFLYIVPSGFLLKYGASIRALSDSESFDDLEDAVGFQKSFWKFAGIITVIYIVLIVLYILGMLAFAFIAASGAM